jgi:hypothetical protein
MAIITVGSISSSSSSNTATTPTLQQPIHEIFSDNCCFLCRPMFF